MKQFHLNRDFTSNQTGSSLTEILVSLLMLGFVSSGIASLMTSTYQSLGREYRLAQATENVRLALHVLTSELRMASTVSPYYPGLISSAINCSGSMSVDSNTIEFLLSHDDQAGVGGVTPYYIGYKYEPALGRLSRGEVTATSTSACIVPVADPLSIDNLSPIANNVVQVDFNNDGTLEPIFSLAGSVITITLGIEVKGIGDQLVTQPMQAQVELRNH